MKEKVPFTEVCCLIWIYVQWSYITHYTYISLKSPRWPGLFITYFLSDIHECAEQGLVLGVVVVVIVAISVRYFQSTILFYKLLYLFFFS